MNEYKTGSSAPQKQTKTLEEAIGRRVRHLRMKLGMKGADFAGAAGISTSMLSKIETGQISASLQTLQAIANALNTAVATLFASDEGQDCSYVAAGQGATIERRGTKVGHRYQLLGRTHDPDLMVEPYLITLLEDAEPYTGFQHEGTELIYMLTGKVAYRHGDRTYELNPGDTLLFNAGSLHGPQELIELPATYLSIITYPQS